MEEKNYPIREYDSNGNLIKTVDLVEYGHGFTESINEYDSNGYVIRQKWPYTNSIYEYDEEYRYEHKLDVNDNIIETIKTIKNKISDLKDIENFVLAEQKKKMITRLKAKRDQIIDLIESTKESEQHRYFADLLFYKKLINKLEKELKAEDKK